jgi:hypothetical protein
MKHSLPKTYFEQYTEYLLKKYHIDYIKTIDEFKRARFGESHRPVLPNDLLEIKNAIVPIDMLEDNELSIKAYLKKLTILYHFHASGYRMYRFSDDLYHLLRHTDLKGIDTHLLKSPHRCFSIRMPEHFVFMELDNSIKRFEYIHILFLENEEAEQFSPSKKDSDSPVIRTILIQLQKETKNSGRQAPLIVTWILKFREGDIFTQVEKLFSKYMEQFNIEFVETLRELFDFVINALLYLTSDNIILDEIRSDHVDTSKLKNPAKILKAEKRNARYSKYSCQYVGKDIKLDKQFKEAMTLASGKRSITAHWVVRGHWRNQPCGKNLSERKIIWIRPYYKGKGIVEIINSEMELNNATS